jgi:hypothetical protein
MWKSNASDRVVYQYECTKDGCNAASYIGYTISSLAKRFYMHVQTGAIHIHNQSIHNCKPFTKSLLETTRVLYKGSTKNDLTIAEALLIKNQKPRLNQQDEGHTRILRIFKIKYFNLSSTIIS